MATVSGRAGEPCPDVLLFSPCRNLFGPVLPHVLLLPFLLSFFGSSLAAAATLSPVVLLPSCLSLVFSSSSTLDLLLACSPHVVLLVLSGHSLPFFCPHGVFVLFLNSSFRPLLSSLCPPLVFLLSCCCRAVYIRCFPRQGPLVCGRPRQP